MWKVRCEKWSCEEWSCDEPRPQRRPRTPQLVQEALCTAPATRKAAAAPAAATCDAARPGRLCALRLPRERQPRPQRRPRGRSSSRRLVYCACHAKGSRGPSGGHARRSCEWVSEWGSEWVSEWVREWVMSDEGGMMRRRRRRSGAPAGSKRKTRTPHSHVGKKER